MIVGDKTPARRYSASIIQLVDVRAHSLAYAVSLVRVAADDLEIIVRIVLGKLLRRQPFPQELPAAQLPRTWALITIPKGPRQTCADRQGVPKLIVHGGARQFHQPSRRLAAEKTLSLLQPDQTCA